MHYLNRGMCCTVFLMLAVPVSAYADSWSCSRNDHIREVVIDRPGDGPVPCSVVYKKPTEKVADQTLWSAENAEGYCMEKAEAFIDKLQTQWNWSCAKSAEQKSDTAEAGDAAASDSGSGADK